MSTADQWQCPDEEPTLANCDACLEQLADIGNEVVGALDAPVVVALDGFTDALNKLINRLKWGARKQLAAIEDTAVSLGPMPVGAGNIFLATSTPEGMSGLYSSEASRPRPADPVQTDPLMEAVNLSTARARQDRQSVDLDQPHVLKFDERAEPWHDLMRRFYGPVMDSFLDSRTLDQQAKEQAAIRDSMTAPPPAFTEQDITL